MPYYPNAADSFSRGLQAGASLGNAIRMGRESREAKERQDRLDSQREAILQMENPGLVIADRVEGTDGRPDALKAGIVDPGTEGDRIKALGGGVLLNLSEKDRASQAAEDRDLQKFKNRIMAEHEMNKKYRSRTGKFDASTGMQIFENDDGTLSYAPILPKTGGEALKGTFDRETIRMKDMSDVEFKNKILQDEADRAFKADQAQKDREAMKSLADLKATAKATGGKKTEMQAKANVSAEQAFNAEKKLDALKDVNPSWFVESPVPFTDMPERFKSSERKQFEQAAEEFTEAALRFKTGAAVTKGEVQQAMKIWIRQPGDDAKTIANKEASRKLLIKEMKEASGDSFDDMASGSTDSKVDDKDPLGLFK